MELRVLESVLQTYGLKSDWTVVICIVVHCIAVFWAAVWLVLFCWVCFWFDLLICWGWVDLWVCSPGALLWFSFGSFCWFDLICWCLGALQFWFDLLVLGMLLVAVKVLFDCYALVGIRLQWRSVLLLVWGWSDIGLMVFLCCSLLCFSFLGFGSSPNSWGELACCSSPPLLM